MIFSSGEPAKTFAPVSTFIPGTAPDDDANSAAAQDGSPRTMRPISNARSPPIFNNDDVGFPERERSYSDGDLESNGRLRWKARWMAPCCFEKVRLITFRARIRQAESEFMRLDEGQHLEERIAQIEDSVRRHAVAAWDNAAVRPQFPRPMTQAQNAYQHGMRTLSVRLDQQQQPQQRRRHVALRVEAIPPVGVQQERRDPFALAKSQCCCQ